MSRCRKQYNIGIDGLEFEFQGRTLLADVATRQKLANDIADVLLDFVDEYYTPISFKRSTSSEMEKPRGATRPNSDSSDEASEAARWRVWKSADGKYSVNAKFIKRVGEMLTLEKRDGATVDVKLESLSLADREFIRLRKWKK